MTDESRAPLKTKEKGGREEPLKVSDTHLASGASPLGSATQCGTMISMNGTDSLSDVSFSLCELGRVRSRTDSRLGFQQEVGTCQQMSVCYYFSRIGPVGSLTLS